MEKKKKKNKQKLRLEHSNLFYFGGFCILHIQNKDMESWE